MSKNKYYITTPIYYVNDIPHIGHAYTTLACDALARFHRLSGFDVKFLTGTDEHGQKVEKSAEKIGKSPQSFTDEVSERFRALTKIMNFSNDDFIRTTEPRHIKAAQELWKRLEKNGHIYLDKYAGWYSVRDEAFYNESELVNGKAPTGADVEWVEEESYFFDLSKWQDKLLKLYEEKPDFIAPESRRNEVISFVKGGLKDLSVSRTTFKWGIPVPGNDKHIMYVWLDALANYLTAAGFPWKENKGEQEASESRQRGASAAASTAKLENFAELKHKNSFWPANLHMVGKDIVRFHAVYWPAFLMAADLPLPKRVFAHGWWTNEGQKISKSLGNVIDPIKLVEEFGLDQTRYFLLREVPFGNDGNFARDRMTAVINSELANNIGNLAQRTLSMIQKTCGGKVPEKAPDPKARKFQDDSDLNLLLEAQVTIDEKDRARVEDLIHNCRFDIILGDILSIASKANEFIDTKAPWALKEDKEDQLNRGPVLYALAETIRCIALMLQPFIPDSAGKLLDQLAVPNDQRSFEYLKPQYALQPGTPLPAPQGIFPRIQEKA